VSSVSPTRSPTSCCCSTRTPTRRLHCDPSNVTLLSERLEEKGIAERRPHRDDRRVRTLVLTPAGETVRRRLLEHIQQHSLLAALDAEQQRQLQELLTTALAGRRRR
jgi:MarR family transcriptional regulator, organic hydroperoxide resistance regulator